MMTISTSNPTLDSAKAQKNLKLIEVTYKRNTASNYTEEMETLAEGFSYEANKEHYWIQPEFSMLYGSPLWHQSSEFQKRTLNHLYWICMYSGHVCYSEIATMVYNQMTCGAFYSLGLTYDTLCRELDLETTQERGHVNSFRKVGERSEQALYGEIIFSPKLPHYAGAATTHPQRQVAAPKDRIKGYLAAGFFSGSPFAASQYYTVRGIRNITGKVRESNWHNYCLELEKQGAFVPTATAIASKHFYDEAFHTATSQLVSHEMYKDFKKPSRFEIFFVNSAVKGGGQGTMSVLGATVPGLFQDDYYYMPLVYRLLQTPLFGMNKQEAVKMIEDCYCKEHEGFQVAAKYHGRAVGDCIKYLDGLDFLWPVNREMQVMGGATIANAIQNNTQAFRRFARSIA
jgi:hypothetical protein